MRIDEYSVLLSLRRAVRYANNDIGQVDVGLVQPFSHHIKALPQSAFRWLLKFKANNVGSPMTTTPLLPPNLALELSSPKAHPRPRNGLHHLLALLLKSQNLVMEPPIPQGMLVGSHGSITDIFREVSRNAQNTVFGDLWKVRARVGAIMSD